MSSSTLDACPFNHTSVSCLFLCYKMPFLVFVISKYITKPQPQHNYPGLWLCGHSFNRWKTIICDDYSYPWTDSNTISITEFLRLTMQGEMEATLRRHCWSLELDMTCPQVEYRLVSCPWPQKADERGRPKTTRWRTMEAELEQHGQGRGTVEKMAEDKQTCRTFVAAIWASRRDEDEPVSEQTAKIQYNSKNVF